MTTINETELDTQSNGDCTQCYKNDGDIYLCGEGYICTECFAELADIDESEAFIEENITVATKDKIRGKLGTEAMNAQS